MCRCCRRLTDGMKNLRALLECSQPSVACYRNRHRSHTLEHRSCRCPWRGNYPSHNCIRIPSEPSGPTIHHGAFGVPRPPTAWTFELGIIRRTKLGQKPGHESATRKDQNEPLAKAEKNSGSCDVAPYGTTRHRLTRSASKRTVTGIHKNSVLVTWGPVMPTVQRGYTRAANQRIGRVDRALRFLFLYSKNPQEDRHA